MAEWRARCGNKLVSVGKAIGQIRRGERIFLSAGSAVPQGAFEGLCGEDAPLADNEIMHLLTLGPAPYAKAEMAGRFRHRALFIGPNVRSAVAEGRADYTPVFLSEIPELLRTRKIPVDVAIVSMTPPDEEGYCNYGTHIDISPAAVEAARVVIAEINPRMPWVNSGQTLHVDQIGAFFESEHPLPELPAVRPKPEMEAIARHIAELIPDGATLQLGIGGIPDGVLKFIGDRKDLGIHTEMFSDGVIELVERGVITGRAKTLHPNKIVASFILGSAKTYEWLDRNPKVELYPSDYVNDPFVIAQNDKMIAINTCLEIDLTGQVCSDSIGQSFYSGIGGQVDFIRGAARSRGGKPIIALPSTAMSGIVSRIVPRLDDGAGVVTTRGDVHYVVTEYGVADLHGRTVRERAMALIGIAHPKFRPWLLAEAKRQRLIYTDQLEPPVHTPLYPKQLETRMTASQGQELLIRPIKPTDESLLHDLFYGLSNETVYERFFATRQYFPHENLQRFCTVDYDQDMCLVASFTEGHVERIVGWACYFLDPATGFAEASFVVDDRYQGQGIGTTLMRRLTEIAEARALKGFRAHVLSHNARMLRVFEKCGYPIETSPSGEVVELNISFEGPREAYRK